MKDFFKWDEGIRDLSIIVGLFVLVYVSTQISPINLDTIFSGSFFSDIGNLFKGEVPDFMALKNTLVVLALVFFAGIIWISLRSAEVHHKEHEHYAPIPVEIEIGGAYSAQWQAIVDRVNSDNVADWKIAILEADNLLDNILREEGYQGDSIGDRLKSMNPLEFRSYGDAWEAHKVRNEIAHEGATMDLSKKLAHNTILKFENVFREFDRI